MDTTVELESRLPVPLPPPALRLEHAVAFVVVPPRLGDDGRSETAALTALRFANDRAQLSPPADTAALASRLLPRVPLPTRLLPSEPEVDVELLYVDETLRVTRTVPSSEGNVVSDLRIWERERGG